MMQFDNIDSDIPKLTAKDRDKIRDLLTAIGLDESMVRLIAELSPVHSITGMVAQTYVNSN